MPVAIHALESEPFAENSYVVWVPGNREAIVVDPGFEPDLILDFLVEKKLTLAAILNTHGHVDHIAGNGAMKQAFPNAPLVIGEDDAIMLTDADVNMSAPFGMPIISPPADVLVKEGQSFSYAGLTFDVLDLPGHSPGHVVFLVRQDDPWHLLGGDVLFHEGIGRTDFPGGSFALLKSGIRKKLFGLPAETIVYPGHGTTTTIGHERVANPFVGDHA